MISFILPGENIELIVFSEFFKSLTVVREKGKNEKY